MLTRESFDLGLRPLQVCDKAACLRGNALTLTDSEVEVAEGRNGKLREFNLLYSIIIELELEIEIEF